MGSGGGVGRVGEGTKPGGRDVPLSRGGALGACLYWACPSRSDGGGDDIKENGSLSSPGVDGVSPPVTDGVKCTFFALVSEDTVDISGR